MTVEVMAYFNALLRSLEYLKNIYKKGIIYGI